jgi:hypothetical protein
MREYFIVMTLSKDEYKEIWKHLKERLDKLLADGTIKSQAAIARDLSIPQPTVNSWFKRRSSTPRPQMIDKIREFINQLGPTKNHHTPRESVRRKADIIAENLEITLPLLEWFVAPGTEEDRDLLREVLGTDLSFQFFETARALLTEMHHTRVLEERNKNG